MPIIFKESIRQDGTVKVFLVSNRNLELALTIFSLNNNFESYNIKKNQIYHKIDFIAVILTNLQTWIGIFNIESWNFLIRNFKCLLSF